MTIRQQYQKFLNEHFKGLKLRSPLFFNWPFALRFDLQEGDTAWDEYFAEVFARSSKLFHALFCPEDEIFFVMMDYKYRRDKIRSNNFCFRQIDGFQPEEVIYYKQKRPYEVNNKSDVRNVAVVKLAAGRLNIEYILKAIGNTDFPPRTPRLDNNSVLSSKEVYLLNIDRKVIFHMYDDRGLDIIANDIETIRPVYKQFNSWILEANRERIDNMFSDRSG